ncbi:MAG: Rrf2 family transcriptional regulator [Deltaproteobacteria bacterium]|nr:Rrf2 family transcriptional regulator [Deltaproteobacteria bacterium]
MKLSRRARYALRMMVAIARQTKEKKRISLTQVAKLTDLSRRYLEQLAIALKNASLIVGKSGKTGGYMLGRPAADIKVGQIVEAAIGPINIVECLSQPDLCMLSTGCECRWLYQDINDRITDVLYGYSLQDLADKRHDHNQQ